MNFIKINKKAFVFHVFSIVLLGGCAQTQHSDDGRDKAASSALPDGEITACSNTDGHHASGNCLLLGLHSDVTAGSTDHIWARLIGGYQLKAQATHPEVRELIDWYTQHPRYLQVLGERAKRYIHYITEQVEERGLPSELALLPAIESTYDPFAYSPGQAAGLWQFVPGTAKHVGLQQSWWYDGRRDVISSTQAALDYLEDLHKRFDGDWLLALAAYNSGAGTVSRAIRRNERAGKPTDYWSLKLPAETQRYIPKLLALSTLIRTAEQYDFELLPIPNEPYFATVEVDGQVDLAWAAELADLSVDEIYGLNPGFNRWATDPNGPHRLLLPVDSVEAFRQALAEVPPEKRLSWTQYTVQPGDTLIRIAREHHTDIATIKANNQLDGNLIRVGQTLLLPSISRSESHYSQSAGQRLARAQRRGGGEGRTRIYHEVRHGESLWSIARRYGVRVKSLTGWNDMSPRDVIRPGQKLAVWKDAGDTGSAAGTDREVIRRVGYTVRRGDSLARIASKFNVGITDIVKWNKINPGKYLQPGQSLTLYVDVTKVTQLAR